MCYILWVRKQVMRPRYEVSDILQRNRSRIKELVGNRWQLRTLTALRVCRTYALGLHIDRCSNEQCREIRISYNSCRNRHCPKCQGEKREKWIHAREEELLNTSYYHVVFTLPSELNTVCLYAPGDIYGLLFKTAWSVIKDFGRNPKFLGAKTGMISILHTWGQNLSLHPHLHCIVPGGGITPSGKWKHAKGKDKYLFPVRSMSKVFRARFVEGLRKLLTLEEPLYQELFKRNWVVYAKRPFYGPAQVIEYLGRYSHKIAISNHRIKSIDNDTVTFTAKDYRHGGKKHTVTLTDAEFIRRFSQHILPQRFMRIRHYGIFSSALKNKIIPMLQEALGKPELPQRQYKNPRLCPVCKTGELETLLVNKCGRSPPSEQEIMLLLQHAESMKK